jgi:mono/diheme cytochrome c family protein
MPTFPQWLLTFGCVACWTTVAVAGESSTSTERFSFERHVRPILKAHCFTCHGEAGEREGELDLRLRRFLVAGGDSGPAVVPGKPEESLLFERVRDGEMPPGDTKVTSKEIETLEAWIRGGAPTLRPEPESLGDGPYFTEEERAFWAFQPIRSEPVKRVDRAGQVRNAIDPFLLDKLAEQGQTYSDPAERLTLLRRASYSLIGLPPTPEEMDRFLADDKPDAYERLVDRLLASPQYGERWGRHWLDVAGYADSEGYTPEDPIRDYAYKYRDFVIRSFNDNKPFDLFVHEQLAGDEMVEPPYKDLVPDEIEKLVATGFLRMGPDGTAAKEVDRALASNETIAETIKITSSALMGLTVGCAQCHDHRYDPIPQTEYYGLRAIFEPAYDWKNWRNPGDRLISLLTDAEQDEIKSLEAEASRLDAEYAEKEKKYRASALERELLRIPEQDRELARTAFETKGDERTDEQNALLKRYAKLANFDRISVDEFDWELRSEAEKLEARTKARKKQALEATRTRELAKVPTEKRTLVEAAANLAAEKRSPEQTALVEQFRGVAVTAETLQQYDPKAAEEIERDTKQVEALRAQISKSVLIPLKEQAAAIRAKKRKPDFLRALTEVSDTVPDTFFFFRGDHNEPRQPLEPARLTILASSSAEADDGKTGAKIPVNDAARPTTGRRLAFAHWLTSDEHPLTARVIVNRVWMHHFGRGIVDTPDDFGILGARPTHPRLLDWLAQEFRQSGWDLKRLQRLIVTSTAFRQSSKRRGGLNAADPDNRLYGRMSVHRLEAEVVRDSVLAASGGLNREMFGKPVPVMKDPAGQIVVGVPNVDTDGVVRKVIAIGAQKHRRSVYIQMRRSRPLAILETFDAPEMSPNCSKRVTSTVTPQALLLMNSHFTANYANDFADRLIRESGDQREQQIERAWRLAWGTVPSPEDQQDGLDFLRDQTKHFQEHPVAGSKRSAEEQALAGLCQALMCSNAFLYVD